MFPLYRNQFLPWFLYDENIGRYRINIATTTFYLHDTNIFFLLKLKILDRGVLKKPSQKSKKEFYAKIVIGLKQSKNGLDVDSLLTLMRKNTYGTKTNKYTMFNHTVTLNQIAMFDYGFLTYLFQMAVVVTNLFAYSKCKKNENQNVGWQGTSGPNIGRGKIVALHLKHLP